MKITPAVFEAYLKCSTKCWLRATGQLSAGHSYAEWVKAQNVAYRANEAKRLIGESPNDEVAFSPDVENLKAAKWRLASGLAVEAQMDSCVLESELHAVERVPAAGPSKPAQFIPIRFAFTNKLGRDDRLLLAFDAFVLSKSLGCDVSLCKIVHGDDHATLKVKTSTLVGEVRKLIDKIAALLLSQTPPDLVLNRHCAECEFQARCRKIAIEKDDLSLLSGMSAKERQKLRSKGIFTVTQLSYTFRPRRRPKRQRDKREKYHHSLKALAIRERKIHIVGSPELKIEGTPVYLDVEGLPDRDFYYLIGVRIGNGESAVQHSLWADKVGDEGKIWREFLSILETVEKPALIYYGSYETTFLRQMRQHYPKSARRNEPTGTIRCKVNLLSAIFAQFYFPTYSNGLKEIGRHLKCAWSDPDSSATKTIAARHLWETTGDQTLREYLIQYNKEDCLALEQVTQCLQVLTRGGTSNSEAVALVDDLRADDEFHQIGKQQFAIEDFKLVAGCAYFDYQRSRIYVRSNPEMRCVTRRKSKRAAIRNRPNKVVFLRSRRCWRCKSSQIVADPKRWHHKLQLDLRISSGGIRRWITEFRAPFYRCLRCKIPIFPRSYKRKPRSGHSLLAWIVHQHMTNRVTFENLEFTLRECFGVYVPFRYIHDLKYLAARYYKRTYDQIFRNIASGRPVHADETKMDLVGETGYVWVFTSLVDVGYLYRPTRSGDLLHEMLNGFCGVLVTDFYSAYDSLNCHRSCPGVS